MNKILVVCGPTATGKTALAVQSAKSFNGELVSADSRQVYRGMDLITGKEKADVPIWLYDVVDPDEEFSVSHWVKLAGRAVADIQKRNKLPIVVGGTGLYIHALLNPLETVNIPPDSKLRAQLSMLSKEKLQKKLQMVAPNVWKKLNISDSNNPRRLIRKIEIAKSKIQTKTQTDPYDYLLIGLKAPLVELDKRIDARMNQRKKKGIEREIARFLLLYDRNLPSMSAIGLNEHAYARRQLTWFRKDPTVTWFDITKPGFQENVTEHITRWYNLS
jgi:tRNA dimethylallyltransferase